MGHPELEHTGLHPGELDKRSPFAQFQLVDVTFNSTANGNTDVVHSLSPTNPEDIRWIVVRWEFSAAPGTTPVVYYDSSATRRPWGTGYIVLRCNVASARARLLLFVERP